MILVHFMRRYRILIFLSLLTCATGVASAQTADDNAPKCPHLPHQVLKLIRGEILVETLDTWEIGSKGFSENVLVKFDSATPEARRPWPNRDLVLYLDCLPENPGLPGNPEPDSRFDPETVWSYSGHFDFAANNNLSTGKGAFLINNVIFSVTASSDLMKLLAKYHEQRVMVRLSPENSKLRHHLSNLLIPKSALSRSK